MHDISSCSMYATPAVGRPSERETLLRVSKRQEMRSLSPGRGIPMRTSTRNAKDPNDSAPEISSLYECFIAESRRKGEVAHSATLARLVTRVGVSLGFG